MNQKWQRSAIILLALVGLSLSPPAITEWTTDPSAPTPICTAEYRQHDPRLVAVDGGFITTWNDQRRENTHVDVYAQKFTIDGEMLWPEDGRVIAEGPAGSLANQWQSSSGLVTDGGSGALIAWNDFYAPYFSYFQGFVTRVSPDGTVNWGNPGESIQAPDTAVPMMANSPMGSNPMSEKWGIAADSEGGLFTPIGGETTAIARFGPDGGQRTDWYRVPGETAKTFLRLVPAVEFGGEDAIMVTWVVDVSLIDDNILVRKLVDPETNWPTVSDTLQSAWGEEPVQFDDNPDTADPTTIANVCRLAAVPDGSGGVIAVWMDDRIRTDTSYFRVYAQRVDAQGNPLWQEGGIEVSGDVIIHACHVSVELHAVSDGEGGVYIGWNEADNTSRILRAQRLDSNGIPLWSSGGIVIDVDIDDAAAILGLVRATDGSLITLNYYPAITNVRPGALLTQKLNNVDGELVWGDGQLAYEGCFYNYYANADIVSDGAGGAVIVFEACDGNIYANRTEAQADLTVNKIMAPRMLREDKPVTVRILIGNKGEVDVTGSYAIGLYFDGELVKEAEVSDTPPAGAETTVSLPGVRIAGPSPGSHVLEALVDIYAEIPESDEENNSGSINVRVK